MNDEERHLVGIRYKNNGNEAAIELAKKLIDGEPKELRLAAWKAFIKKHPHSHIFCFRGGQRSQISQSWLSQDGIFVPRLKGGYKAFRHFLTTQSERIANEMSVVIIGGRTGSGKTILLQKLKNSIDLEGLANHRGSTFGYLLEAQPSQIAFENALSYALIQHESQGHKTLIIEHESRNIGKINIPHPLFVALQKKATLIILETPIKERVEITFKEYVTESLAHYHERYKNEGDKMWFDAVCESLARIQKRLGLERYKELKTLFSEAFKHHQNTGDREKYKAWIEILLVHYYDPMYDYQIEKSTIPIIFRGDKEEILQYLQ